MSVFTEAWELMAERVHSLALEKGWWDRDSSICEKLCLVHTEISEAVEGDRHGNPPDDKLTEFSSVEAELADAVIRIMDLEQRYNLNIAAAIEAKHEFNKSRPYKHGKLY